MRVVAEEQLQLVILVLARLHELVQARAIELDRASAFAVDDHVNPSSALEHRCGSRGLIADDELLAGPHEVSGPVFLQVAVRGRGTHERSRVVGPAQRRHRLGKLCLAVYLSQQLLNRDLGFVVGALTELVVAQQAAPVPEIQRRPDLGAIELPDLEIGIRSDRELDAEAVDGVLHERVIRAEPELRRMHADHPQPEVRITPVPLLEVRERAK